MNVGFHIRYQQSDDALIALLTASWLNRQSHFDVSVMSLGKRAQYLFPEWDNKVKSDAHNPLQAWFETLDCIVWFRDASILDIKQAKRSKKKTVLVASWDDPIEHVKLYPHVDQLISMSQSLTQRIRDELQIKNIKYVPLELPDTTSCETFVFRPDKPRLLLNLRGQRKSHPPADCLSKLFNKLTAEWLIWAPRCILNSGSWLHSCIETANRDSSFKFTSDGSWDNQRLIYSNTDLTIFPYTVANNGFSVLASMKFGAPVVAYETPPLNEYITRDNGVLTPCHIEYTEEGNTVLVPDLRKFENTITKLLTQKNTLRKMKKHTKDLSTNDRFELFRQGWYDALN